MPVNEPQQIAIKVRFRPRRSVHRKFQGVEMAPDIRPRRTGELSLISVSARRWMATISASTRYTSARLTSPGFSRGHLRAYRERVRAGRDRAGPVPEDMRIWALGAGFEAPR